MKHDVILPKQGIYEGEVELIEWIAPDGSAVEVGAQLYLLGTDKVEVEVLAEVAGILTHEQPDGFMADVGTRVGFISTVTGEPA
jgi:pyruvate/2-oxoglutarate dehydrogenase complex dihydrolipoamide acyltransferase (E2) component